MHEGTIIIKYFFSIPDILKALKWEGNVLLRVKWKKSIAFWGRMYYTAEMVWLNTKDITPKRMEYNVKCSICPLSDKLSNF